MTDKQLLELAAKAAGLDGEYRNGAIHIDIDHYWNPLTDDGDALWLAVHIAGSGWCFSDLDVPYLSDKVPCWLDEKDPYAATRRAIVRAAAEIGKGEGHA